MFILKNAASAEKLFSHILQQSIVLALAILLQERKLKCIMNKHYQLYCGVMAQARVMLEKNLITMEEFSFIDRTLSQKYKISSGSIFRDIRLINPVVRGNMRH